METSLSEGPYAWETERLCRICGQRSPAVTIPLVTNGFRLHQCAACKAVLVEDKPTELDALYDELFAEGEYEAHRLEFEQLKAGRVPFRFFRQLLLHKARRRTKGKVLVEIGGGTGAFAALAKKRDYKYANYDISEEAVRCQRELGNTAVLFNPSELPPLPPADIVVMWEVIEHVWDVSGYLTLIQEVLKPGGVFLFSTPNFAWPEYHKGLRDGAPLSSPPVHLNFFTMESLRNVLYNWNVSFITNRIRRPHTGIHFLRTALGRYPPSSIYGLAETAESGDA